MNRLLLFAGIACASFLAARPAAAQTPETVRAAEYFFDADPGVSLGIAFPISSPDDTVNITASVAVPANLSPGEHTLYVRTLADTPGGVGRWSLARGAAFSIQRQVVSVEYFFDTDPGVGLGISWPTAFGVDDSVAVSASISTTGLTPGRHILYVRSRSSAGAWGMSRAVPFFIQNAVAAAEYFFDVDPGVGAGTPVTSLAADDSVDRNFSVAVPASLPRGTHTLFVRTRSSTGAWGLARGQSFFVKPRIAAAEYFWDTDPGAGAGIALAIASPMDSVDASYTLTAPCLSPGQHFLYLRTRDESGVWSLARADTLTFVNPAVAVTVEYPGPGPYGTPVKVKGSGGQAPYTYRVGAGAFAADSIFLVNNGAAATFETQDACGYSATAIITAPPTPPQLANGPRGGDTVVSKGWRHWFYALDSAGHIIGAVRDGGQSLGEVRFTFIKNPGTTVRQFGTGVNGNRPYLDRNWLVQPANNPTAPVGIAFFATNAEFAALDAAEPDPSFDNRSDLYITKYDGPNEDLQWSNNSGGSTLLYPDSSTTYTGGGPTGYALWTHVNSFSEFYQNGNYSVPLVGRALTLDAERMPDGVRVRWNCDNEEGVARHTLQRQLSSGGWNDVTTLGAGRGDYDLLDENITTGTRYYRVRLTEESGAIQFSRTVTVRMEGAGGVVLSPNPAHQKLRVTGLVAGQTLRVVDAVGRVQQESVASGTDTVLDIVALPPGDYWLQIRDESGGLSTRSFARVPE